MKGYTWNFKVYCGRDKEGSENSSNLRSENVVMTLMHDLLKAGRMLYIDNFYTSLSLANIVSAQQTLMCGTLRLNKKGNTKKDCETKLKKGEMIGSETENSIRVIKWLDKRPVLMMTNKTEHSNVLTATGQKTITIKSFSSPMPF